MTNLRRIITTSIKEKIDKYKFIFFSAIFCLFSVFLLLKINSLQETLNALKSEDKKVIVEIDKRNIEESYNKIFNSLESYRKQIEMNNEIYVKSIKNLNEELSKREEQILNLLKSGDDKDVFKKFEEITKIKEYK